MGCIYDNAPEEMTKREGGKGQNERIEKTTEEEMKEDGL